MDLFKAKVIIVSVIDRLERSARNWVGLKTQKSILNRLV